MRPAKIYIMRGGIPFTTNRKRLNLVGKLVLKSLVNKRRHFLTTMKHKDKRNLQLRLGAEKKKK